MIRLRKKAVEEETEDSSVARKLNKDLKDLKPENRKKRKEPAKPWGKRERVLIFALLAGTSLVSGILALSARSWKLPGLPRLTLPTLSLEQKFILENDELPENEHPEIINSFKSETDNLTGVYGLYVYRLFRGDSYGVSMHEVFPAASLIKLPVMAALYRMTEDAELSMSQEYYLTDEDRTLGAGSLQHRPIGYPVSVREIIRLMGKESDNTAFRMARRIAGDAYIEQFISRSGMSDTSLERNESTPYDIGTLFRKLTEGGLLNDEHSEEMLEFLTDTAFENWLTAGIPNTVRVAHKYGTISNVVNDAGVIFADKPYIVVIMSKGVVVNEADQTLPIMSEKIYNYETSPFYSPEL